MRSVLWILLVSSASKATSDSPSDSTSTDDQRASEFALADAIYDKQQACDAIVGEEIVKYLERGNFNDLPVVNDKYIQCRKDLDEKKREYISIALGGMEYYATTFTVMRSNKRLVTLPAPSKETLPADFDLQQELCMTNELCKTLLRVDISTYEDLIEQKKHVASCLNLLNGLKLKYVEMEKFGEEDLKRGKGIALICTNGPLMLAVPERRSDVDYSIFTGYEEPKIESAYGNEDSNNIVISENPKPANPTVVSDMKSAMKERSEDQETIPKKYETEVDNRYTEDKITTGKEEAENYKSTISNEGVPNKVELFGSPYDEIETKSEDLPKDSDIGLSSNNAQEEALTSQTNNVGKEESVRSSTLEDIPEENLSTLIESSENTVNIGKPEKSPHKDGIVSNEEENITKNRHKEIAQAPKMEKHEELVTYKLKVITTKPDGEVVRVRASGKIKKTDSGTPTSTSDSTEPGFNLSPTENNTPKRRLDHNSLENNIIMMENDCQELLKFGENLLKHKMLSSLVNLENHYNDCITRLDALKRLYIEQHQVDVGNNRRLLPVNLPSGEAKLLPLPSEFLQTDSSVSQPHLNMTPGDVLDLVESVRRKVQSRSPSVKAREPFDDPAFLSNEEFLKSLQQVAAAPDTSRLSKVASMLHMNGGHGEKKIIAE